MQKSTQDVTTQQAGPVDRVSSSSFRHTPGSVRCLCPSGWVKVSVTKRHRVRQDQVPSRSIFWVTGHQSAPDSAWNAADRGFERGEVRRVDRPRQLAVDLVSGGVLRLGEDPARRSEFELAGLRGLGSDTAAGALNAGAVAARATVRRVLTS
jgi:hypothetical protein